MTNFDQYAVFGNPIAHSKSPKIHALFAEQVGLSIIYQAKLSPLDGFEACVSEFFAQGGRGCNVTLPFKEQAFLYADQLTQRASLAGAVNTLKKLDDGQILADNTDGEGLVQDLLQNAVMIKGANILLLGAGGAARGVISPLLDKQPASITISNRTFAKAELLADLFQSYGKVRAGIVAQDSRPFDLVINSTSASLHHQLPDIDAAAISANTVCYDMMYQKGVTCFNEWARSCGCKQTLDGLGMLVGQAAESFFLWTGQRPEIKPVIEQLRFILEQE